MAEQKTQVEPSVVYDEYDVEVKIHLKTWLVVLSASFAYYAQLVSIVGAGLLGPSIGKLFNAPADVIWISQPIVMSVVILSPLISQAADVWGRKWFLVCLNGLAIVGAIIVSRAQNMATMIVGQCVLASCTAAQPLLHAVVSEVIPRRYRPLAQSSVNIGGSTGAITGICMGGALLRHGDAENYRVFYYVVAGAFAITTMGFVLGYNPPLRELQVSLTFPEKVRRLDLVGNSLLAPGLLLFCIALSWSKNPYPWSNPRVSATFAVGLAFCLVFGVYETRFKKNGILHHALFKDRNFAITLAVLWGEGLGFFSVNSYFAYQIALTKQASLLVAGLHFGVVFLTAIPSAFLCGWFCSRWRMLRWPNFFGFSLFTIFFICMSTTTPGSSDVVYWGYPVLLGIGLGIVLPTITSAGQLATPPEMISVASSLIIAVRSFGAVIGLAVNNAIFNDTLSRNLGPKIGAAVIPLGFPKGELPGFIAALTADNEELLSEIPGVTPDIIQAGAVGMIEAFGVAFRNAWITSTCFFVAVLVACFFVHDDTRTMNAHIDAPAEERVLEEQLRAETHRKHDDPSKARIEGGAAEVVEMEHA